MSEKTVLEVDREWISILEKYSLIKSLYIECEETDPDLKTNLQPLNEFRAALDHIMKMQYAYYVDNDENEYDQQVNKLNTHLTRAFYDICDMLSINYRNKIIDILEDYDTDTIRTVIPNYYSDMKPKISEISMNIVEYRTQKGGNAIDTYDRFEQYKSDIDYLREYYKTIIRSQSIMDEYQKENELQQNRKDRKILIKGAILGVGGSIIAAIICKVFGIVWNL